MGIQFVDYSTPTNTAPNVLARWDAVREDPAAREEFVNQMAAELQAMTSRATRAQRTIVHRDSAIQQLEGEKLLPSHVLDRDLTRWEHFKAVFL